jgi:hypothetical protein
MTEYVEINHADDPIIKQLIAVDYYLHHKVKPQTLFLDEIERSQKTKLIEEKRLNHHKYRHIILPLNFNYELLEKENKIEQSDYQLILQYDGVNKAEVVY